MRFLAWILTFGALAFAGERGVALWQSRARPAPLEVAALVAPGEDRAQGREVAAPVSRNWPALFGEPQPPAPPVALPPPPPPPQPVPAEELQPPKPPKPPLDTLGYSLKGLVQTGTATWAMVSHPTGEKLVTVGEVLEPDVVVARIDEAGVWVSRDGDEPELLAFPQDP